MAFPTRAHVISIFKLLSSPPAGSQEFFAKHVSNNLTFHAVGPPEAKHVFVHKSKEEFTAGGIGKLSKAVKPPGIIFKIVDEEGCGVVVDETRGTAAIMLDTVDTETLGGVPYNQHYSWHVQFGKPGSEDGGLITSIWAFLDHRHLEEVLGPELEKLEGV